MALTKVQKEGIETLINNNADDRVITGSGTANTLEGEANLTFDGNKLTVSSNLPEIFLTDTNASNARGRLNGNGGGLLLGADNDNAHANSSINLQVDGSTKMSIDSSGNVGIGTTSPVGQLHSEGSGNQIIRLSSSTHNNFLQMGLASGDTFHEYKTLYRLVDTDNGERFRIHSNGNLIWTGAGSQYVQFNNSGDLSVFQTGGTSAGNHGMLYFKDGGGAYCGQITSHGTNHTTSYNTNSDYRLKENESSITDGITRLKQLKPYRFDWKSSGDRVDGFFAHEAQTVVPESVIGTKDEVDADNKPKYQGIDQAKLVPLLTAALQEAIAKIETLETKVAALEAA